MTAVELMAVVGTTDQSVKGFAGTTCPSVSSWSSAGLSKPNSWILVNALPA